VLTIIIIPWQPLPPSAEAIGMFGFVIAILKELIIGTLAGFAASLTFGTMQIIGELMGLGSGFGSSRIFNPAISESGSAFDQLFTIIAMMVFMVIDGHHVVILAISKMFEVIPINGPLPTGSMEVLMRMTAQLILTGVQIALPVMAALTMADVGLGLVSRVAPRIQIYFLGLPLKVGLALAALSSLFLIIFPALNNMYGALGNRMLQLIGK
jgi:flagellar biosynthetic protein FliR